MFRKALHNSSFFRGVSVPRFWNLSNDFDFGSAGASLNVELLCFSEGSFSVEKDFGMGGTEGVLGSSGVLLNRALRGRPDLLRKMLFLRGTPSGEIFGLPLVASWAARVSVIPVLPFLLSEGTSPFIRDRLLLGDGDGEREADAQDFRANFEIDPETECVLRCCSGVDFSLRSGDSYPTSSKL